MNPANGMDGLESPEDPLQQPDDDENDGNNQGYVDYRAKVPDKKAERPEDK